MKGRFKVGAVVLVVVAVFSFPAGAHAVDATVDFESVPPETTITNQFANVGGAGQGPTFGPLPGAAGNGFRPVIKSAPGGLAHSGTQVADVSLCNNGFCGGAEFYPPGTTGTFQSPRQKVSVRVGVDGAPVPNCSDPLFCTNVTLRAYNANGDVVGTPSSATVPRGAGFHTLLSVETPSAQIRGFQVRGGDSNDNNEALRIDDLTYDVPTGPVPPDFTLTPSNTFLVMSQGQTLTVPIEIGRTGGSTGNVDMALTGPLPSGVTASFSPDPAGGSSTNLVLTAAPDAALTGNGFEPISLTVSGNPLSPGAGAEPRTFPISLQVREAFAMTLQGPTDVNLSPCAARVPIQIRRDFGFPGPVSLSVDGLANGLQASFEPGQITFPNGAGAQSADLIVKGPATGLQIPATPLTIRASAPGFPDRTVNVTVRGRCPFEYDARVTSLEITQGVQTEVLPQRYTEHPGSPIPYAEIPGTARLQRGATTVVRVYANLASGPPEGVPNVPMVLSGGYRRDIGDLKAHEGSPISSLSGARQLDIGPELPTATEIGSETAVYSFVLPDSWVTRPLRISAHLLPSTGGPNRAVAPCETEACEVNDAMGISSIPFDGTRSVTINPFDMQVAGSPNPNPSPATVFNWMQMMTPTDINVLPYAGTFNITNISNTLASCRASTTSGTPERRACADASNSGVAQFIKDWTCDNSISDRKWNVGINTGVARGLQSDYFCYSALSSASSAVVEWQRPTTSVGHETGHLLGLPHADLLCGGNEGGSGGEAWPPDDMGFLQSVGLATTQGTGWNGGPFAVMAPPKQWFDYMSYCANSGTTMMNPTQVLDSWISVRNWNRIVESLDYDSRRERQRRAPAIEPEREYPAPRGAPVASLNVSGFATGDTALINAVRPVSAPPQVVTDSVYRLVGLDGSGQQVANVPMVATTAHIDGEAPGLQLDGLIPSAGVESVAIVRDGTTLASRGRSASDPTVSLSGKPSFQRGTATLRWNASDPDGDELLASVEYSGNGGKSFERIFAGPTAGSTEVPAQYLHRSNDARLRVTVNDGFREASVTSKRFRSPGAPPDVTILGPPNGTVQPNDAPLSLTGQAYDDRSTELKGKSLTWFSGKRKLGTGDSISPDGLRPGRHKIELVARDDSGRAGRDSISVRLLPTPPAFLDLAAPDEVKKKARTLNLRVASTQPAKLKVSGAGGRAQTFSVSRKARGLAVRIAPGSGDLDLRLQLKAGKETSEALVSVARG